MSKSLTQLIKNSKNKFRRSLIELTTGAMLCAGVLGMGNKINAEDVSAKKASISDLVAYWSFNSDASETNGNKSLDGTFVGNAHIENVKYAPVSGNRGCLVLDGAPSRVNLSAPLAPIIGELKEGSIEAWGYLTSSNPEGAVIFNSGIPAEYTDINLWIDKKNNLTHIGFNDTNFYFPLKNFQLNEWHHYAWSWNDYKIQFWMDNNLMATQSNSRSVPFRGNEAEIGSDDQEWGYWIGKLDEVKIWNKMFSPTPLQDVQIISPLQGEVWEGDSIQTVHWKSNINTAGTAVRFELWNKYDRLADLGYGWNPNGEEESYVLVPLVYEETNYNIRAYSLWDSSYWAGSENITITGKPIKLVSPNGGESWKIGSIQPIHWEANPDIAGTGVYFELWRDSGRRPHAEKVSRLELSASDPANKLGMGWDPDGEDVNTVIVPDVEPETTYRVRVISTWDEKYWDDSDGYITIQK